MSQIQEEELSERIDDALLLVERRGRVLWLTMNRPEVLNARNTPLRLALVEACRQADADDDVWVVVLTGAGDRAFSVGRDLRELSGKQDITLDEERRERARVNDGAAVAALSKPIIAAINGYALGGGLELALACDLRVAADHARLGLPEVKRGLIPGSGGTQRLPRAIPVALAMEMILTGEPIDAQRALTLGLVNAVVPLAELPAAAEALAERVAANAPVAVRYAKEAIRKGLEMPLADGLALEGDLSTLLKSTADWAEGPRAFVERRAPNWQGR